MAFHMYIKEHFLQINSFFVLIVVIAISNEKMNNLVVRLVLVVCFSLTALCEEQSSHFSKASSHDNVPHLHHLMNSVADKLAAENYPNQDEVTKATIEKPTTSILEIDLLTDVPLEDNTIVEDVQSGQTEDNIEILLVNKSSGIDTEAKEVVTTESQKSHSRCKEKMKEIEDYKPKHIDCECALFSTKCPSRNDRPLMHKQLENISCHGQVSGEETCSKACITFALAFHNVKEDLICLHINNATNLTVYLQTKICQEDKPWTFTGLSTPSPICCHLGKVVTC